MKITIIIDRGQEYGQERGRETEAGSLARKIFKSLIATEFPVGIMSTKPSEARTLISYSGPITDFIEAIRIKKEFLASAQTSKDKKRMLAKLIRIYQKSGEEKCVE